MGLCSPPWAAVSGSKAWSKPEPPACAICDFYKKGKAVLSTRCPSSKAFQKWKNIMPSALFKTFLMVPVHLRNSFPQICLNGLKNLIKSEIKWLAENSVSEGICQQRALMGSAVVCGLNGCRPVFRCFFMLVYSTAGFEVSGWAGPDFLLAHLMWQRWRKKADLSVLFSRCQHLWL